MGKCMKQNIKKMGILYFIKILYLKVTLSGRFNAPEMLESELFLRSLHLRSEQND